jgi:hypothetical protein
VFVPLFADLLTETIRMTKQMHIVWESSASVEERIAAK